MGLFRRGGSDYDRTRILDAASRARARGRRRKAIALYRRVLAVEPEDAELHWRIAPLLAETGQGFDAWRSFRRAARELVRQRRAEQALATYKEAARLLPLEIDAWQAVARLERRLGRHADAKDTLLAARRAFRRRRHRPQAIALLRLAREIDPEDVEVGIDLARTLAKASQRPEAGDLLERLAAQATGRALRRVRGAQWRMSRSLSHTWLWLRAALAARGDAEATRVSADNVVPLSRSAISQK